MGRKRLTEIYVNGMAGSDPSIPTDFEELEAEVFEAMSEEAWGDIEGTASTEGTAANNTEAFDRWRILPKLLQGVETRDLSIELRFRCKSSRFPSKSRTGSNCHIRETITALAVLSATARRQSNRSSRFDSTTSSWMRAATDTCRGALFPTEKQPVVRMLRQPRLRAVLHEKRGARSPGLGPIPEKRSIVTVRQPQ